MQRPPALTSATASNDPIVEDSAFARVSEFIFGRRLPSSHESRERLSRIEGLAVLSSDVLSSTAYATEELLLVLVSGAVLAFQWALPVSLAIVGLLVLLTISYRQTIRAYPQGAGAYNVAKANLGVQASLIAAAGLLIDYVLTVAVSVTAGAAALTSAFPDLRPYRVWIALAAILVLVVVNLRGIRTAGKAFTAPTLLFIGAMLTMLGTGLFKYATGNLHPNEMILPDEIGGGVTLFLLLRAFSAGTTALTGMEAIADGVFVFRKPEAKNARTVLLWMALTLGILFTGVTWLASHLHVMPGSDQTVLSEIARMVFGHGPFYYIIQISTLTILVLAAN